MLPCLNKIEEPLGQEERYEKRLFSTLTNLINLLGVIYNIYKNMMKIFRYAVSHQDEEFSKTKKKG
jgi:uncharacterized membrane protein